MTDIPRTTFDATGPLPGGTCLLEASAGTGKTYTITSLTLRLVAEQRLRLPEIAIVTFTRAATSELRNRVRTRLVAAIRAHEQALADPGSTPPDDDAVIQHLIGTGRQAGRNELRGRLEALVTAHEEFDDATITTIHGFCHDVLQQSPFEGDLDAGAELLEDLDDLLAEVTHDFLVREHRDAAPDWYRLLRDEKVDRERLLEIARAVEAEPHLEPRPGLDTRDPQHLLEEAVERLRDAWRAQGDGVCEWLMDVAESGDITSSYTATKIADKRPALDALASGQGSLPQDPEAVTEAAEYFGRAKITDKLRGPRIPGDLTVVNACEDLLDAYNRAASLVKTNFSRFAREQLERRKDRLNVLSFNDLLQKLDAGLGRGGTGTALREVVRDRYEVALIDEFQDTDPVQWSIFSTVFSGHGRLFLIGDPKQAIYGFRGADVDTYLTAAGSVPDEDRYTLDTNWRSDQRYVDALNHLLNRPGIFGRDDIGYVPVDAPGHHQADRFRLPEGTAAPLQLRVVSRELGGVDKPKGSIRKPDARSLLADEVAADIGRLVRSDAIVTGEEGGQRAVAPRDCAVLVRTNKEAEQIQEALLEAGVAAVHSGGGSVFESDEAEQLQRLLDAMLRPHAGSAVRAALATPILGLVATELIAVAEDERRWEQWVERLSRWAAHWREEGIAEAVRRLSAERDVAPRLLSMGRGERRMTNVSHLLELLHAAEREHDLGPSGLAGWLRERRQDVDDADETELRLESDDEAVTVMTVHRAKGLEFPLVWCPFLWDGGLLRGGRHNLRLHDPDTGELILDLHVDGDRPPKNRNVQYAKQEDWQEQLRLLYVALTRARHRCVVHWGPFNSAGSSALAHILHGRSFTSSDDGHPQAPKGTLRLTDEEILADLRAIADGSRGTIAVQQLREPGVAPESHPPAGAETELHARPVGHLHIDGTWRRTSFSALTRPGGTDEPQPGSPAAEGEDRDDRADLVTDGAGRPGAPQVPLAHFPRGPGPGLFLHGVLEDLDFTRVDDPGALERIVAARQARHGQHIEDRESLLDGLRAAVKTPLGADVDDLRLADIDPDDRLVELDFHLPLAGGYRPAGSGRIDLPGIAAVLEAHADRAHPAVTRYVERLRRSGLRRPTRGFLTGAIDLTIRRHTAGGDRFHIVDHKSNWLGRRGDNDSSTVDDYHPDALADAMVGHDYVLQYLLYLVALHRFLGWRLGGAYDYDRHVGGALYLFLRGMVGPDTPRDDEGRPHGIFADRPPRGLIEDLDEFLHDPRGEGSP